MTPNEYLAQAVFSLMEEMSRTTLPAGALHAKETTGQLPTVFVAVAIGDHPSELLAEFWESSTDAPLFRAEIRAEFDDEESP